LKSEARTGIAAPNERGREHITLLREQARTRIGLIQIGLGYSGKPYMDHSFMMPPGGSND
jgi:hypothetical protein